MKSTDYKKDYKDLYLPKITPMIIDVPEMIFIMINGKGDPNTSIEFKNAMDVLYGLSYTIKMSKMNGTQPEGYFDYVVPPLEGLWWIDDEIFDGLHLPDKNKLRRIAMIRQPEFVTREVFLKATETLSRKKPHIDSTAARYEIFTEGKCVQIMHIGSYDDEPETILKMEKFIKESGFVNDISDKRRHHEIYLSDPRKTAPEKIKTVIRHPVRS